eukprot:sb/3467599/
MLDKINRILGDSRVYRVQIVHRAFLNQLFKTNPTQPELAFYLIGKCWVWHVHFWSFFAPHLGQKQLAIYQPPSPSPRPTPAPDDSRTHTIVLQIIGIPVYRVQIVHRAFLNQLFKTNPTQPELAFYLIGKCWVWHVHFWSFFADSEKLCGLFGPYTRESSTGYRPNFPVSCLPCSTLSHRSGAIIGSRDKPLAELQIKEKTIWVTSAIPTDTSKQPIRTRYLGHVTGYQPIRDQYFLIRSEKTIWVTSAIPTDTSKQPIRTRYLGHVTGNQPIRDKYFLIRSVPGSRDKK